MNKYKRKPEVVEAVRFTGYNYPEVNDWVNGRNFAYPDWIEKYETVNIPKGDGFMVAHIGDYIIKGENDEFFACNPEVFENTYEFAL